MCIENNELQSQDVIVWPIELFVFLFHTFKSSLQVV